MDKGLTTFPRKTSHVSKPEEKEQVPMLSCGRIAQEEVLVTGTDLINITTFVVLFIAFCEINAIMHG